jgi:Uma2 family endonuclease
VNGPGRDPPVPPRAQVLAEPPLALPSSLGPYRRPDYERVRQAEPRCELIRGRLYGSPAPSVLHQTVVQTLWRHLHAIAQETGGRAYFGPAEVVMADHSVVRPDVCYVGAERRDVLTAGAEGVPDLVVEVIATGMARRDRGEKLKLYADRGVAEYWIAEPEESLIEFLVNQDGRFVVALPDEGYHRSAAVAGVHLDVEHIWQQVGRNRRHD